MVRRGEEEVFRRLEAQFRANREVTVIWDRRLVDQPAAVVSGDRRITPITTWQDTAYILVPRTRP